MTAMPQPSLTPQLSPVARASLDKMKITLDALRLTILNLNLGAEAGMQMLAEEITLLTGSVGAAIALKTNDQIVCQASIGQAPGMGAVLQPGHGLSGECVLTGKLVQCDDTDVDPRVNPQVCRELGFRSVLIAPITLEGQAIGLVELLAAQPHHFNQDDVLFLDQVAAVVLELNGLGVASNPIEQAGADIKSADFDSLDAELLARFDVNNLMAALEQDTSEESTSMTEIDDAMIMQRLELIQNGNTAALARPQAEPAVTTRVAPRPQPGRYEDYRKIWMVALLLIAVGGGGIWIWKARRVVATSQSIGTTTAAPVKVVEPSANLGSAPAEVSYAPAATRTVERPAGTGTELATQKHVPTLSPKRGSTLPVRTTPEMTPVPSIAGLGAMASNAPVLPAMSQPASPVFQPTKVSSGLRGGTPIYQPRPAYPETAKRNGLAGDVVLRFLVTKDGTVTNVRVVSGNPTLVQAAVQSVKLWRYRPFLLNGEPTEAESQATIKFTSPR